MSRAFITVDESVFNSPIPELNINGQVFRMSERELNLLAEEIKWAQGCITAVRAMHWKTLANKYKETQNVA